MFHIRGGFTYEINNMQDSVSLLVLRITEFNRAHDFGFHLEIASFDMQWHAEHVKHAGTTAPVADRIFDDRNSGDDAIGILLQSVFSYLIAIETVFLKLLTARL